jgi:ribosomal protein S24E
MREQIINTEIFKNLENFRRKIYSSPKNIMEIERLYGIANRLGFDYMIQNQNPNNIDKLIIKELLNMP